MRVILFFYVFALMMAAQDVSQPLPSADDVVAQMMERDNQRQAALHDYTAVRRYVLENTRHHKRAEMLVKMKCLNDGSKQFEKVSETGWGAARSHVFPRLLESESEASLPNTRERSRLTPENYSFEMVGMENINERPAYVIAITPKTQNKYLVRGRIWVDLDDFAIARIEGEPAKNLSFWIKSVHFVHSYHKSGLFWLPVSDRSVTDARFIGTTELTIEYFDYSPNAATLSASREPASGSLQ
ncbi:MAG: hypothetical protein JOZ32_15335 [Bryobacterales bacterium]|nr:hypothetical protein [Bryobacterales bacterium]